MKKIITEYHQKCSEHSDINEHLPTLFEYATLCKTITEMGTRFGLSTIALLASNPVKMISYDIKPYFNEINNLITLAKEYNIDYTFITADVLSIDIESTDLLFIDTLHTYNQLFMELLTHSKKVNKFIIIHDTFTFGYHDEYIYDHASDKIKKQDYLKTGLIAAIDDFLALESSSGWTMHKKYLNNNGLIILKNEH